MNSYTRYSDYVLYVLYACIPTQVASPAKYGMSIILEGLCISPTEVIRQGDEPYMQQPYSYNYHMYVYEVESWHTYPYILSS